MDNLENLRAVLGLDLGVNSLGWAVVAPDENRILDAGVRIFPAGINEKTLGMGERELSKNAERRMQRMMRRMFYRKRLRKIKLLELLIEEGMCPLTHEELRQWKNWDPEGKSGKRVFPDSPAFREWLRINPYEVRYRAIHGTITKEELGRALYHMIQRRGFQSSRKGDVKEEGVIFKGERGILDLKARLGDKTLGEYLYEMSHKEGEPYSYQHEKEKGYRLRNRYTLREMYIAEFDRIWEKQAPRLGLSNRVREVVKRRYLKGNPDSKRNRERIDALKRKYGEENVRMEGNWVITVEKISLKELLGGKIHYENGKIRYRSDKSVLFWQRPLRSQKFLLGECRYESTVKDEHGHYLFRGRKPCPVSHPDYERFRAWQFINNISYGKNYRLTPEQKEKVMELLDRKEKVRFREIPKLLGLSYEKFNYEDDLQVKGNPTVRKLKPLFPARVWEEKKYDIWHAFYFYTDNDLLFRKLKDDFGLLTDDPEKIAKIRLEEGYGSLSLKAIRNILPYLEKGHPYSHAVLLGGVRSAFGARWGYFRDHHEEIEQRVLSILREGNSEGETIRRIREYLADPRNHFGFTADDKHFLRLYHPSQEVVKKKRKKRLSPVENLRNPVVQQGLNEMRRLVNDLLDEYRQRFGEDFEFSEVHVEFARDLKLSREQRAEMTRRIRENEERNREARERILEYGLRPSRENIQKYLLFKEIEERAGKVQCPYTGRMISINDLLGPDNRIQIEHIIPFSISLDDSFANKTLCESNFNRDKGELTPYQYYQKDPDPGKWGVGSWEEVEQRAFRLLPYTKARRFVMRKDLSDPRIREGFIERQLNDTRYISRKAASLLTEIADDVRVMPGQVTAELRHLWGLNNLLSETTLEIPEVSDLPEAPEPHHLVLDAEGRPVKVTRIKNPRPRKGTDELLLPGEIINDRFFYRERGVKEQTWEAPGLKNGKYWMKIRMEGLSSIVPVFRERPAGDEKHLVLSGTVTRGRFTSDTLPRAVAVDLPDGPYWGVFPVLSHRFLPAGEKPQARGNKVVLFGHVREGRFRSYIYEAPHHETDGACWVVLETDLQHGTFTPRYHEIPEPGDDELLLTGTVNQAGTFVPDADKDFLWDTDEKEGKYRALFRVDAESRHFFPMENPAPATDKGQKVVEGDLWVDTKTGEIRFDPKKSRDDHRHHAIDAITVALTTRSHLHRLSNYNARRKAWEKSSAERPRFDLPWKGFVQDVRHVAERILVSYRQDRRVLTRISKRFEKEGKQYLARGTAARGALHRETYFGRRQSPGIEEKFFHVRKDISEIKNHKHVEKIVDEGIKKLIREKLRELGVDISKPYTIPDGFFFDQENRPTLFLPNRNGDPVPVKKVRMKERIGNAVKLKNYNVWVNPYNNHHILLYRDEEGNLREEVVTFWEAVNRLQRKEPLFRLPPGGREIVTTLQINDLFLLGYPGDPGVPEKAPPESLSPYLYRVQKISSMYYTFRHHLASNLEDESSELRIQSFSSWEKWHPIKVRITRTGKLKINH